MLSPLPVVLLLPLVLAAAELQDTLRQYLRALNRFDAAGTRAVLASYFEIPFSWTRELSGRLLPTVENCPSCGGTARGGCSGCALVR